MNDRILELAEESDRYALYMRGYCNHNDFNRTRDIKFAELIIKECSELVSCNAHVSGFALGDLIKEHFEIE